MPALSSHWSLHFPVATNCTSVELQVSVVLLASLRRYSGPTPETRASHSSVVLFDKEMTRASEITSWNGTSFELKEISLQRGVIAGSVAVCKNDTTDFIGVVLKNSRRKSGANVQASWPRPCGRGRTPRGADRAVVSMAKLARVVLHIGDQHVLEERVPLFGASTSGQQAIATCESDGWRTSPGKGKKWRIRERST